MAIETEPGTIQQPGGAGPGASGPVRARWMRPAVHTAIIGAVAGYLFGHWLGNLIASGYQQVLSGAGQPDVNDTAIVLGYLFMVIGWLIGLGFFNDLVSLMRGRR